MGVERLKTFRLTCDGEVMWTDSWGEKIATSCETTAIIQAHSRQEVAEDLRRNVMDHPHSGWHLTSRGTLWCPRSDHLKED